MGLREDHWLKVWEGAPTSDKIPMMLHSYDQAIEWLKCLSRRRERLATRLALIRAPALDGVPIACVLEALFEAWPATLQPRSDYPDTFRLQTIPCPMNTPEKVIEDKGVQGLVAILKMIRRDSTSNQNDDAWLAKLMEISRPVVENHRAWAGVGIDGNVVGARCGLCGWEAEGELSFSNG